MTTFADDLRAMGACSAAVEWVGDRTLEQAWAECERADWMLWLYRRRKPDKRICVTLAIAFAERVAHLTTAPEAKAAVDAARGWLAGTTTEAECRKAADAAAANAAAYADANAERKAQADLVRQRISVEDVR